MERNLVFGFAFFHAKSGAFSIFFIFACLSLVSIFDFSSNLERVNQSSNIRHILK